MAKTDLLPGRCKGEISKEDLEATERRVNGIFIKEEHDVLQQWQDIPDYPILINLNRAFLKGQVPFTNYYLGPIFKETKPMVAGLLDLHDFGMLTVGSLPSATKEEQRKQCECCGALWYRDQQRAFISLLLPTIGSRVSAAQRMAFLADLAHDDRLYFAVVIVRSPGSFPKEVSSNNFPEDCYTHVITKVRINPVKFTANKILADRL